MTINHMNYLLSRRCLGNEVPAGELAFAGARVPAVSEPRVARGEGRVEPVGAFGRGDGTGEQDCFILKQKGGYYGD